MSRDRAAIGRLVLSAIMDGLIGSRLSAKELATRALAVGIVGGHHLLTGKTYRALGASIGVSHTALRRRVRAFREQFRAPAGKAEMLAPAERKTPESVPSRAKV